MKDFLSTFGLLYVSIVLGLGEGLGNGILTYWTSISLSSDSSKASARNSKLRGSWWCCNKNRNWEGMRGISGSNYPTCYNPKPLQRFGQMLLAIFLV